MKYKISSESVRRFRYANFVTGALLASCSITHADAPTLEASEIDVVLTKAVVEEVKRISKHEGYCIARELAPSNTVLEKPRSHDGWLQGPKADVFYRQIKVPPRGRLPREALAPLPAGMVGSSCRSPIVFEEPYVIQIREGQQTYLQVTVDFSNRCPICGAGFEIGYRQTDHGWQVEPPGIVTTFIS